MTFEDIGKTCTFKEEFTHLQGQKFIIVDASADEVLVKGDNGFIFKCKPGDITILETKQ